MDINIANLIPAPRDVVANILASFFVTVLIGTFAFIAFIANKKARLLDGILPYHEKSWVLFRTIEFRLARIAELLRSASTDDGIVRISKEKRGHFLSKLIADSQLPDSFFGLLVLELTKLDEEAALFIKSIEMISQKNQRYGYVWAVRDLEKSSIKLEMAANECLASYKLHAAVLVAAINLILSGRSRNHDVAHNFGNYAAYFCGAVERYYSGSFDRDGSVKESSTIFTQLEILEESLKIYWDNVRQFSLNSPRIPSVRIYEISCIKGNQIWPDFDERVAPLYAIKASAHNTSSHSRTSVDEPN